MRLYNYCYVVSSISVLFFYIFNWKSTEIEILSTLCGFNLLISILSVIKFRRSPFFGPFFFILAYTVYSILIGRYLFPEIAAINEIINYEYDFVGLILIYLFTTSISLQVKNGVSRKYRIVPVSRSPKNLIISLVCLIVAVLSQFIFSTTVESGRAGYSAMYEYSIVFYIIALFYSLNTKYLKYFVLSVFFLMIFRDIQLGHRATSIQISLLIYALVLSRYYTFKRFLLAFCIATVFMNLVAVYRSTFSFEIDAMVDQLIFLFTVKYLAVDTAYFAYVASLTFLSVREMVSASVIMSNLGDFIVSLIVPGTYGKSLYSISKEHYQHANGGILPLYLFYYFGYLAIPIITTVLAYYFNLLVKDPRNTLKGLVFIYVFVTIPRWLLYAPTQLFRGVLLFCLVVLAIFVFKNSLNSLKKTLT